MKTEKWIKRNTETLTGKTVAVTGSTGGLGRELVLYLASLGASLVLVDRNRARSEQLARRLEAEFGVSVVTVTADLEDLRSVGLACERLKELPIDVFIHNAGAYSIPRRTCENGYDNVFNINFVSPYYIIKELLPVLHERGGSVVAVGSIAHRYSRTDSSDVDFSGKRAASLVYGNAKRYLMYSLFELFRDERGVGLSIVHPGITFTNITAHYPKLIFAIIKHPMKLIFMKPRRAALSLLIGAFESCSYCEWIGPCFFDIWGLPKKKKLRSADEEERRYIGKTAERIYFEAVEHIRRINLTGEESNEDQ